MVYDEKFMETCQKLGNTIKRIREEKQITIKELSEKTGIRAEYLRKIEQGEAYGVLIDKHLLKIACCLNLKMSQLLNFQ